MITGLTRRCLGTARAGGRGLPAQSSLARIAIVTGLLALAPAAGVWAQSGLPAPNCGEPAAPPVARVEWIELPSPGSQFQGRVVTLRVTNLGDVPASVRIAVIGDTGDTNRAVKRVRVDQLDERTRVDVRVDPRFLGPAVDGMRYSGQLLAMVSVIPEPACARRTCESHNAWSGAAGGRKPPAGDEGPTSLASPPIYFHREGTDGRFTFYGEGLLASRYGGGDLERRFPPDRETTTERVTDDGDGNVETLALRRETRQVPADQDLPESAGELHEDEYRLCFKFEIGLTDAGKTIVNQDGDLQSESYWNGVTQGTGGQLTTALGTTVNLTVTGRGVSYKVLEPAGWSSIRHTDPATGCGTFRTSQLPPFQVRVLAQFRDQHANVVRVHDADGTTFSWGTTVDPKIGKTTVVAVGDYTARATLAAVAGFATYRSSYGMATKRIDIAESSFCTDPGGAESSAHFDFSDLDAGLAHVRLHDGQNPLCSSSDHRRQKFVITHELGHAWLLLRTLTPEPDCDAGFVDASETTCNTSADGYQIDSVEYSCIGFRESAAHLYAARVFNNRVSEATFTWFTKPYDVETNVPDSEGGRLGNVCSVSPKDGASTVIDWLRFWWDWYAPHGARSVASLSQVAEVYASTIAAGDLNRDDYWARFRAAATAALPDAGVGTRRDCAARWNGIDTSGGQVQCDLTKL